MFLDAATQTMPQRGFDDCVLMRGGGEVALDLDG